MATDGATLGEVTKVELLCDNTAISLPFIQNGQGLTVTPNSPAKTIRGINNATLAAQYRVLRITHAKTWINDDDPGVRIAQGLFRQANLNHGDFNNDLTISNTPGAKWQFSFTGKSISVIAPTQPGGGKVEILVDGRSKKIVDLSADDGRHSQQVVYRIDKLATGKHVITLINRGGGPVAIDALTTGG